MFFKELITAVFAFVVVFCLSVLFFAVFSEKYNLARNINLSFYGATVISAVLLLATLTIPTYNKPSKYNRG